MSELEKIPIPLRERWRAFRFQGLPILLCAGAVVAVTFLWREETTPNSVTGEVEMITADVAAPESGALARLTVRPFEEVESGDIVGHLLKTPPDVLHSSLALLQAEIELTRLGWMDPVLDQQRNIIEFGNLRFDWLSERASLAIRRVELQQAEREYDRVARLLETEMVSEEEYDRAKTQVEILRVDVTEKEELIEEMDRTLQSISGTDAARSVDEALRATLKVQKERLALLEAELRPMALTAPISGTITSLQRRSGENVRPGDTILTIRSNHAEQIVAFARQPLAFNPEPGMAVRVRTRGHDRREAEATILSVGGQMEELPPSLRRPFNELYESGLPILVSLPAELEAVPGEVVDVRVR